MDALDDRLYREFFKPTLSAAEERPKLVVTAVFFCTFCINKSPLSYNMPLYTSTHVITYVECGDP
jgi:hypothetical protein